VGTFLDDKRTGRGIYKSKEGARYEGEFYEDKPSGYGKLFTSHGDRFVGTFENGEPKIGRWVNPYGGLITILESDAAIESSERSERERAERMSRSDSAGSDSNSKLGDWAGEFAGTFLQQLFFAVLGAKISAPSAPPARSVQQPQITPVQGAMTVRPSNQSVFPAPPPAPVQPSPAVSAIITGTGP